MKYCKYNLTHTWIIRNVATALIGDLATVDGWTAGHVGIAGLDLAKGFRPGGVFFGGEINTARCSSRMARSPKLGHESSAQVVARTVWISDSDLANLLNEVQIAVQKIASGPSARTFIVSTFVMVLEAIYEQDFLPCSYGFRPGRSAHQALQALRTGFMSHGLRWVIDL